MTKEHFFSKQRSSKELPIGGLIDEAGSSKHFKTGDWKSFRPIIDENKCINCMFCVVYCPENCIRAKDDKRGEIDLSYCKGCLICQNVCPVKCISNKKESEFTK
ncbi:MAG: 4Fe-4S binding protein [Candidatus Woesearchaeota archaeon]|jgi:pyruvate ferredoxin oxidoreductase delta subunit|nr:4Fe-4S binding protein [Candidatus Woesearchaeota archaeon]